MIDISIVSGTYNRIGYLQKMVNSVREAIGDSIYGLSVEFVLVDGGSKDGTIEWCKDQPDIRLIEHGKLLGAVKAFNDGAYNAIGQYVILANDDIEFLPDSVFLAYTHMQTNPKCGIGCFYQDRNGLNWHVDHMPVILNNKQGNLPYGQVCIVPKWLGDKVGWWGSYQHTYGGDNELSSQVYNLGFDIMPIQGAMIHDREADDELRRKNNIKGAKDPRAVKGHHPDSYAWGRKWRNDRTGLVGPIIKEKPAIEYKGMVNVRERILYLPIFEQGWQVQKEQKRGLKEALVKNKCIVYEYDYFYANDVLGKSEMMSEIKEICKQFQPSFVLTQIHNTDIINSDDLVLIKSACPQSTKFINWNGDYWPDQMLTDEAIKLAQLFDLYTVVNLDIVKKHQKLGINTRYWQIGFEPDGVGYEPSIYHDVVFLASGYSPERQKLGRWLTDFKGNNINLGIYGSGWPDGVSKGQTMYDFKASCAIYRGAKIAIGDSQWPESGFVSNRIFQILAAGNCVLCHQWFKRIENLGLRDGENCFIWKDYHDLEWILKTNLGDADLLDKISKAGQTLAFEKHSFDARIKELWNMLGMSKEADYVDWRW